LTRSQWQALAYLAQNEGINQSGLAELLDVEPITLSRILDKLECADQTRAIAARRPSCETSGVHNGLPFLAEAAPK
jgi:DNA-binding MarR family transcriptional regulator